MFKKIFKKIRANSDKQELIKSLQNRDWNIRKEAVRSFESSGKTEDPSILKLLIVALADDDYEVHKAAEKTLEKIAPTWPTTDAASLAVPDLIQALKYDGSGYTAFGAVYALRKIKDKRSLEPLIVALSFANHGLRDKIIAALTELTGTYIGENPAQWQKWLEDSKGTARLGPKEIIIHTNDPLFEGRPISYWISVLSSEGYAGTNAASMLMEAGESAIPQLIGNLKNPDAEVRKMIPLILGKIGPAAIDAVRALTQSCNDSYPMVAIGARYALIMITGAVDEHLRVLCKYLESRDVVSRRSAAHAIEMIGNKGLPAARKLFEMRQKETDPAAHQAASNALQRIGWNPAIGGMPDIDFY